ALQLVLRELAAAGPDARPDGRGLQELQALAATLRRARAAPPADLAGWAATLAHLEVTAAATLARWTPASSGQDHAARDGPGYWAEQAIGGLRAAARELDCLAPWAAWLATRPEPLAGGAREAAWSALLEQLGGSPGLAELPERCAGACPLLAELE